MNELRNPHDPVIPGEHIHPPEGHGGVSMPIGVSGDHNDPHEPIVPEGMMLVPIPQVLMAESKEPQITINRDMIRDVQLRNHEAILAHMGERIASLEETIRLMSTPSEPPPTQPPLDESVVPEGWPKPLTQEEEVGVAEAALRFGETHPLDEQLAEEEIKTKDSDDDGNEAS